MSTKLSSFAASFHDYELDIEYYHGKDLVHQGCLLKLDSKYSWARINSKIRNKIRKAQQLDVTIKRVKGSPQDIKDFRTIWFDPKDTTIPKELEADEIMYLAYMDDQLVGGLILTPSSPTVLYMHNLGSSEEGKRSNIPGLVLWHAVEDLENSQYKYIDVGVSFRPSLYSFFKNWQTDAYPIIFSPPFIKPDLRLTPFENHDMPIYKGNSNQQGLKLIEDHFGKDFTILPRAIYAMKAVLQHIGISDGDNVAVYKTFDNDYITRCVTAPIEHFGSVSRAINNQTKAVVVIHEFGHPYKDLITLKKECEKRDIPLIEDCAWSYGTKVGDIRIGEVGDYSIYSLPKILPLQYGAILTGLTINDEDNWNNYQLLDYFKRELILQKLEEYLPTIHQASEQRRTNWQRLATLFAQDGFDVYAELAEGVVPGAFMVKLDDYQKAFERYESFGVETGRYYHDGALFLPVHQNLKGDQIDYIYGVYRGLLNLSSEYRRKK
jgi:hypothetical protein